jgi:DNA-binding MarR family transcriptional regulator
VSVSRPRQSKARGRDYRDYVDGVLEQWRHERPDIDADGMALIPRLIRLAHLYNTHMRPISRSFGLENGWLDTLSALRRIGHPYRMPATELARSVLLTSGGMTARLDRMEAADLVTRRPDPADRRGVLVELTEHGRKIIDAAINAHLVLYQDLLGRALSKAEQQTFIQLLRKQTLALEELQPAGAARRSALQRSECSTLT